MTDYVEAMERVETLDEGQDHPQKNALPPETRVRYASMVKRGDWLDGKTFPPLAYAVAGIFPEGCGLIAGPPKVGKSFLLMGTGLACARGGEALGGVPTGPARPVLYLALEDGDRRVQDRARRLLDGEPIPANFHYVTKMSPLDAEPFISWWLGEHVTETEKPVVVVDTLALVSGPARGGEAPYDRDYRIIGKFKRVSEAFPGVTLLIAHHTRKMQAADFMDAVSGTNGIAGAADFVGVLFRGRTETSAVLSMSGKDIPEAEYALTLTGVGRWSLAGSDLEEAAKNAAEVRATAGLGDRSAAVAEYVVQHPEGVTPKDVEKALSMPNKAAADALGRLLDQGRIDRLKRGTYTPLSKVKKVSKTDDSFDTFSPFDTTPEGDS